MRALRLAAAGCVLASASLAGAASPGVERVLLVTVGALRADAVGAYGGPGPTPTLDALAAEGVLVEQACTPIPSSGPAHASLLTGLHPWSHGTLRNIEAIDPRIPTLADRLSERGFATAAFVSSRILDRAFGFHQGFERFHFEPVEPYRFRGELRSAFWTRASSTTTEAMRWLTEHAAAPFFVWVHYFDPNPPYDPPPGFALPPATAVSLEGRSIPPSAGGANRLRRLIRAYRGEVAYVDAQLGRLVERLRLLGILDATAVIVTSDHGQSLGENGILGSGASLHDPTLRVPLLIRAPGLSAGKRFAGDAQLEDVFPTALSLAGASPGQPQDGVDLLPWLRGEVARSPREAALGRRRPGRRLPEQFYERSFPRKWVGPLDGPGEAFDLAADPRELSPEPGEGPPERLRASLAARRESAEGAGPPSVAPGDVAPAARE